MRQLLGLFVAAWLLALACDARLRRARARQESYVFGTRVETAIAGVPEAQARAAGAAVLREFDRLHRSYHAWQPSELSALNEAIAAGRSHEVTAEFAATSIEAQAVAAAGDHLFDPGIGSLIALWGFHRDEVQARLPDAPPSRRCWRRSRRLPTCAWKAITGQQPQQERGPRLRRLPQGRCA